MADLPRATARHAAGDWPAAEARASITLPWAERHRRRIRLTDDDGHPFLLDLAEATALANGDGLRLDGGGWIAVRAAAEEVADAICPSGDGLVGLAWHLGNRHIPIQILPGGVVRFLFDHVLVAMLTGLGARVERRFAPFQPETGAYAQHQGAGPGHDQH
jgi:urease accessory protein